MKQEPTPKRTPPHIVRSYLWIVAVAAPLGPWAVEDVPRFDPIDLQPQAMARSIGEREIVDEEPADGSRPVTPLGRSARTPGAPAALDLGSDAVTGGGSASPVPRYLGTVTQGGRTQAVFDLGRGRAPWIGSPGQRIGSSDWELRDLEGRIDALDPGTDGR